jgi:hypothetical protein
MLKALNVRISRGGIEVCEQVWTSATEAFLQNIPPLVHQVIATSGANSRLSHHC